MITIDKLQYWNAYIAYAQKCNKTRNYSNMICTDKKIILFNFSLFAEVHLQVRMMMSTTYTRVGLRPIFHQLHDRLEKNKRS